MRGRPGSVSKRWEVWQGVKSCCPSKEGLDDGGTTLARSPLFSTLLRPWGCLTRPLSSSSL